MKDDHDIIHMLESGKEFSLSKDEHDSIRFTLLDHAKRSLSHERSPVPGFFWQRYVVSGFAAVVLVMVGTAYASRGALPGDPLYAMKVNVVEEIVSVSKFDPVERTEYGISRMETRLQELKTLSASDVVLEEEDLAAVADHIDEHASDVASTLAETEESVISHETKLDTLTKLRGYAKAQADLIDENIELASIRDDIHESEEAISDSIVDAVKEFSEEAPAEVNEYLSEQIEEVGADLRATTTDAEVRESAEKHVHDVNASLTEGDTTGALISILEAQLTIEADELLEAGE